MFFPRSLFAGALWVSCATPLFAGEAAPIVEYQGGSDPAAGEAPQWERTASGQAVAEGPVEGEKPAWRVSDGGNAVLYYRHAVPEEVQARAAEQGWRLSVECRLHAPESRTPGFATYVGYVDTARKQRFLLGINANEKGEPLLIFNKNPADWVELSGLKADEFHRYELVYQPEMRTVRLLVDGEERGPEIPAVAPGVNNVDGVFWGSGDTAAQGEADFHRVRFEILSHP